MDLAVATNNDLSQHRQRRVSSWETPGPAQPLNEADQPEATERPFTPFLDTGVANNSLYICTPIDFQVSCGYPNLAKLLLGLVLLLTTAVVAVIWFVVRRIQRRKARQAAN